MGRLSEQIYEDVRNATPLRWLERDNVRTDLLGDWRYAHDWQGEATARPLADPLPMVDFPPVIDVGDLNPSEGITIRGVNGLDGAGTSVSSAGDIDGDGIDDVIIGSRSPDNDSGESYVLFGRRDGLADLNLKFLPPDAGFVIRGENPDDYAGVSVSEAGDVNGDGFGDIIIGAGYAQNEGSAYVLFGRADGFRNFDLSFLSPDTGFAIRGGPEDDDTGYAVSSAGDVNGDGFDDVIVGAKGASFDDNPGAAYVIFGKADGFGEIDLGALTPAQGFAIIGDPESVKAGTSVSSAGDFNGDGVDDIVVGARGEFGSTPQGAAYVIFGKTDGFGTIDLAALGSDGFAIRDEASASTAAGVSVSSAGDVDGDGLDDVIVGDFQNSDGGDRAGAAFVIFGKTSGFDDIDLATLRAAEGFVIQGIAADDFAGLSVSSAGDINGDGFDDMIVGARGLGGTPGYAYVIFGARTGFGSPDENDRNVIDLATLTVDEGFTIQGAEAGDFLGDSVSSAGDVDGDGFDDIIVGAPGFQGTGAGHIIFGRAPTEAVERIGSAAEQEIRGGDFADTLSGRGGDDLLVGSGGGDLLSGDAGRDTLLGGAGDDRLEMTLGGDRLTGGDGGDSFVLTDNASNANRAVISDFGNGADLFEIDAEDFGGGLTPGALDPDAFLANTTGNAEDAEDRFIYDTTNGKLFYDADGNGAGGSVLIARLVSAPSLEALDFIVV